jgi:hypothetical protein
MTKKFIPMAICYDFDGTLSPGNMQEYDFIKKLNTTPKKFWTKSIELAKSQNADQILAYMKLMIDEANYKKIPFKRNDFIEYGKTVTLFAGVDQWFDRINKYAKSSGIALKHYIISSGLKEMIEGTSIAKKFENIFASSFMYDSNNVAVWPAIGLNYTTKTQFLFRINKGCCDITDNKKINEFIEPEKRAIPFTNMIYIGDGETDIPCMKMVKVNGGHSIAVYPPKKKGSKDKASKLIEDGRVNIVAIADYSDNKEIDVFVKAVVDKVVADNKIIDIQKKLIGNSVKEDLKP